MKNYILIAATALLLSACNQAEIDKAKKQNDSLAAVVEQRDSSLSEILTSFNDVESNLDSVAAKQHFIYINIDKKGEIMHSSKDRINMEIATINNLMDENRKTIAELNKKMKNSGYKNAKLMKTIVGLNNQLLQKEQELTDLNAKLMSSNAQVDQLKTVVEDLIVKNNESTATIDETTTALHTAYYIIGKTKDLEKDKLIDRKGGLLGMGKTSKLNNENIDNSKFTRIDYTQMSTLAINSKNVKIITTHPSDSYYLAMDAMDKKMVNNLVITNAEKFWSVSKYLVVAKN